MWVSIAAKAMHALSAHPPQRITGLPATPSSKKSDNTRTYCALGASSPNASRASITRTSLGHKRCFSRAASTAELSPVAVPSKGLLSVA